MAIRNSISLHQHRGSVIVTDPAAEPISLSDLKGHLRIDDSSEDSYLTDLITEAREDVENASGFALITQTWRLAIDRWPANKQAWWDGVRQGSINELNCPSAFTALNLPKFPLLAVNSVKVYDAESSETDVSVGSTFDIDTIRRPGRMALKSGQTWPIAIRPTNGIIIEYQAGFGPDASDVPSPLRRAVRVLASYYYAHRGDGCDPSDALEASGAAELIDRYRPRRV